MGRDADTLDSAFDHTFCFNKSNLGSTDDQIRRTISLEAPELDHDPVNESEPFFSSRTYPWLFPRCEGDYFHPDFDHEELKN